MSLGVCFKKLHLIKVGAFCLIQRQNLRYCRCRVW